jgi:glyoxalase family protein
MSKIQVQGVHHNGQLLELACYKFTPPEGYTHGDVLATAHRIRVAAGDYNIRDEHLADAISELVEHRRISLTTSGVT